MPRAHASLENKEKRERWISFIQSLSPNIDPKAVELMDELRLASRSI